MIIGNVTLFNKVLVTFRGGSTLSGERSNFNTNGRNRNWFIGEASVDKKGSEPNGYGHPVAWIMAQKAGGLASYKTVDGSGTISGNAAMGVSIDTTLTGSGDISSAQASLIIQAAATLSGIGGLTASLQAKLEMVASLAGSGDLTGALSLLVQITSDLLGSGNVTGTLRGDVGMAANIYVNTGTATTTDIVSGVWNALASDYNTALTMGNKMNSAASAGDPWTTDLTTYSDGTAGFKLNSLQNGVSGSSAISTLALGATINVGVETNTYVDTQQLNGVNHIIDDVANVIDVEYQFNVTSNGTPVEVTLFANLQSANDSMIVYSWDYLTSGWIQAGTLLGTGASSLSEYKYTLFRRSVDTNGDVRIRLVGGSSNPRLDIDLIYVSYSVTLTASDVWNALASDYNTALTMGNKMNSAAGDPWSTLLPGTYVSGTAGNILGNLLTTIPDSVWDELKAGHTTADSYGKIVQDIENLAKQIKGLTAANL